MFSRIKEFFRKRKKIIIIIAVVLVAAVGISYTSVEVTSTTAFCSSCHEMKPAYESYLKSSHYSPEEGKTVATCRACHVPPWTNPLAVLWSKTYHGVKDVYKHFADREVLNDPGYHAAMRARAPRGIAKASCLQCHRDIYEEEYGNFVNIHAALQKNRSSKCVDCHKYLVHWPYTIRLEQD
ncbi:MAG: NapC/NirT family cytochrome c [Anaerolineales bacterium]|nr:NapC/NirT family cytochrome c [Anaerolineales bacterium]